MRNAKTICFVIMVLFAAGNLRAADAWWDADNRPESDGLWTTASNWWTNAPGGMPAGGPNGDFMVGFNHPNLVVCTLDAAVSINQLKLAEGGVGHLRIVEGGSLTTAPDQWSGVGFGSGGIGTLEVDGGSFATQGAGGHLWIGGDAGAGAVGTIILTGGGTITIGLGSEHAQFGLGWNGGTGYARIDDGLLWIANWENTRSITAGSNMDITGGTVRIRGYRLDSIYEMVGDGRITGYGYADLEHVLVNWDAQQEETVITAIPEPAAMVLFGLGGLCMLRKRKAIQ